jgi:general secretion pathway protein G
MKQPTRKTSGFTIVEIAIAVIIIGILAAILIPVLATRAEEAKIGAARRDLEELTNAEERVALDLEIGDCGSPSILTTLPSR